MSKTLEETKEHIIELCKQHHLKDKTAMELCKVIKTDANGFVNEYEFKDIEITIMQLSRKREAIIDQIERIRENKRGR